MAHRAQFDAGARRHHQMRRASFADIFGGPGSNDNNPDPATSDPFGFPPDPPTTSLDRGPTAGPIINRPPAPTTSPERPAFTPPPPPPTTTSSTPPPPPTTSSSQVTTSLSSTISTSALVLPSVPLPNTGVTLSLAPTALTAAAAASASSTAAPAGASASKVGPILGGIAGAIAGIIIIVFGITYWMRKRRSRDDDDAFNPADFRRSAVLMGEPTHEDIMGRGFNPAPHHGGGGMAQYPDAGPVTYGNMGNSNYGADTNAAFGSVAPGWNDLSPPPSAHTAQPFLNNNMASAPGGYGGYDFAPMHSPVSATVAPYGSPFHGEADATAAVNAAAAYPSVGAVRRTSAGSQHNEPQPSASQYANYPGVDANGSPRNSATDYLELSRSSVTPFQAAQYKIISNRIGAPVPQGLETPVAEEYAKNMTPPPMPTHGYFSSPFGDDNALDSDNHHDSFPSPPPVAATRITSTPPMLPEIRMSTGIESPSAQRSEFPMTPSPMAGESFVVHQAQNTSAQGSSGQGAAGVQRSDPAASGSKRPDTVYDDDDVYGGM